MVGGRERMSRSFFERPFAKWDPHQNPLTPKIAGAAADADTG